MPFATVEITSRSNKGWKHPIRTERHTYASPRFVSDRIGRLVREYGFDNVLHEPKAGEPNTEIVYIRLY